MIDDKMFENVPLDSLERTECSPSRPDIAWRGVAIRAPSKVALPSKESKEARLIIPVCGVYFVDVMTALRHPGRMTLVITNDVTGDVISAPVVQKSREEEVPPPPAPPRDPSTYADQAFGGYVNVNVTSYTDLPLTPAPYRIKIEYAGYQSNEVTVTVVSHL